MENYFRIALWMLFVIAYLQGVPLTEPKCSWDNIYGDVLFKELKEETCNDSLIFTSPSIHNNFKKVGAKEAALLCYKQGFKEARNNCKSKSYISETLTAIDFECNKTATAYKDETSSTNYQDFVDNFKAFLQMLNSGN